MKSIVLSGLLAFFAGFVTNSQAVAQQGASAAKASVIDLQKPLPQHLDLTVGQKIVFENDLAKFTAKETDGKGKLFEARPHNTFNQAAAFEVSRVGTGEIQVVISHQGQLTVIRTATIKVTVKARQITAQTIAQRTISGVTNKLETTAKTDSEWKQLWAAHSVNRKPAPVPQVDFTKDMVIAVGLGTRPTSGYRVVITSIEDDGQNLIVTYSETKPPPNSRVLRAPTQPILIVQVPTSQLQVRFVQVP